MEYTFEFDFTKEENGAKEYVSVEFKEDLTDEEAKRLEASYNTGNFFSLYEDEEISDIYDNIMNTVGQLIVEDGIDSDDVSCIRYPKEIR